MLGEVVWLVIDLVGVVSEQLAINSVVEMLVKGGSRVRDDYRRNARVRKNLAEGGAAQFR